LATQNVNIDGQGYYYQWNPQTTNNYLLVDDPIGSPDDDTTKVEKTSAIEPYDSYTTKDSDIDTIGDSDTINKLTVYFRARASAASGGSIQALTRLSSTNLVSTTQTLGSSYVTYSRDFTTKPGGGAWTKTDLKNCEIGIKLIGVPFLGYVRCTQVYGVVDYTLAVIEVETQIRVNFEYRQRLSDVESQILLEYSGSAQHPAPTSLLCERKTNPIDATEAPIFSAIFQGKLGNEQATKAQIIICEGTFDGPVIWNSGRISITPVDHNNRCEDIKYDSGNVLSSAPFNDKYVWKIKFFDSGGNPSQWAEAEFSGIEREWIDPNYCFKRKLFFDLNHPELPGIDHPTNPPFVADFKIKTGNRKILATNGYYNESVQASGGYPLESFNGRRHIVYLSEYDNDSAAGIYIISKNDYTGEWGTPYKISSAFTTFDTHYFPVLSIDASGYIHLFFGCHYTALRYLRSKYPNDSGSLPGDTGEWINPADGTSTPASLAGEHTYPIAFYVPSADRIYVSPDMAAGLIPIINVSYIPMIAEKPGPRFIIILTILRPINIESINMDSSLI